MNKKRLLLLSLFVLTALSVLLYNQRWYFTNGLFSFNVQLDYPSYALTSNQGNNFIIDTSLRRVVKRDSDGTLSYIINGGSRETGEFFYAADITVDKNENLYLINWILNKSGFHVEREEILKFDSNGNFLEYVYIKEYPTNISTRVQRGQLKSLTIDNDRLIWFDVTPDAIEQHDYDIQSSTQTAPHIYTSKDANIYFSDILYRSDQEWAAATKRGEIQSINPIDGTITHHYNALENSELSVPFKLASAKGTPLYFSDIAQQKVLSLQNGKISTILDNDTLKNAKVDENSYTYFRIHNNNQNILTTFTDEHILIFQDGTVKEYFNSLPYSSTKIMIKILLMIAVLLSFLSLVWILYYIYVYLFKTNLPAVLSRGVTVILIIAITSVLIITLILNNFSQRYTNTVLERSSQMVQLIPPTFNTDLFADINSQKDYMGESYQKIREAMHTALNNNNDAWNDRYYFALYRVLDDNLYGFMYLNDGISAYQPFPYYGSGESAYDLAQKGEIIAETDSDSWGTWIYAVGPVRDSSGKVVALLEVGTDLYSFKQENQKLYKQIIFEIITLVIIFTLLLIELAFLGQLNRIFKEDHSKRGNHFSTTFYARPLNFMLTTAVSMSIAFVPVMMQKLQTPLWSLPEDVITALPISLEMLFFAIALLIGGRITQGGRWKVVQGVGLAVAACGLLLSGLSSNMYIFMLARSITGLGAGLSFISFRSLINLESDSAKRSQAYSHFYAGMIAGVNVGVVSGSFLADQLGFSKVFFTATTIALISAVIIMFIIRKIHFVKKTTNIVRPALTDSLKFVFNHKIIIYFILTIIPTYTAGMFLVYYFPLFAHSKGLLISDIGRLFIVNGLFVIYLGPSLSRYLKSVFGDRTSLILGSCGWALALAIFAITGSIQGAIATLIIMGITEGFCVTAQNDYFMELHEVKSVGRDNAAAYLEVAAKFAEIAAPILFGMILLIGPETGIGLLAGIVFVLALLFIPLSRTVTTKQVSAGGKH